MSSPPRPASFSGSNDSNNYDGTQEEVNGSKAGASKTKASEPFSDQQHLGKGKAKGASKQSRLTHFVCFPLVTESSAPQLAESLARFRDVTTAPPPLRPSQIQRMERDAQAKESSQVKSTEIEDAAPVENGPIENGLNIIPAAAHRPPGTFHLTIGVMDLSEKGEMQRALALLTRIDYASVLQSLESTKPTEGTETASKEIAMDLSRPDTSNSSTSTINANPTKEENPSSPNGYRETVSRVDRAILHAMPHSPAYRKQEQERRNGGARAVSNGNMHSNESNTTLNNNATGTTAATNGNGTHHPHQRNPSTDLYGRSGYKETVSTIDRYVDKTYDKASRFKQAVKSPRRYHSSKKDPNGRDTSPSRQSMASTVQRRLLSLDNSRTGSVSASTAGRSTDDAESLYTINSITTERPTAIPESVAPAPNSFDITLSGISAFSSPKKARVFYAPPVDEHGTLLAFAEAIRRIFVTEGLVKDEGCDLVLHATLANMSKTRHKRPVDGRSILDFFNGNARGADRVIWARDVKVDRVRICKMGAVQSEDSVLGMVYPAVEVDLSGEEGGRKGMETAEVVFA